MARPSSGKRAQDDLIGTPWFWISTLATLAVVIICLFWPPGRMWLGCGTLLMWTAFSAVNGVRCGRVHSLVSAPVYLLAAAAFGLQALGKIDVQDWLLWVLAGGLILANISERVLGKKYLA